MPYTLFFPDLVKNVMTTGWAKLQQPDGMITESLSGGCMGATGHCRSHRLSGGHHNCALCPGRASVRLHSCW